MKKGIYKLNLHLAYSNGISQFVATDKEIEILKDLGIDFYWCEIDGKYSEIEERAYDLDIQLVTDDESAVEMFEKYGLETGVNPFNNEIEARNIYHKYRVYLKDDEFYLSMPAKDLIKLILERQ